MIVLARQGRHGEGDASGGCGDSQGAAGSSAVHAAVDTRHAGEAASGGVNGSESGDVRAQQRKRCRGVAVGAVRWR